jgi:hypothetical protein
MCRGVCTVLAHISGILLQTQGILAFIFWYGKQFVETHQSLLTVDNPQEAREYDL